MKAGISVYVGLEDYSLAKNIEYLQLAKKYGVEYVFSSFHISEAKEAYENLCEIASLCETLQLKLILDVSRKVMDSLIIPRGIYAIRLDCGFNDDEIVNFNNNYHVNIDLNASTMTKDHVIALVNKGLDIKTTSFSFNFYPKLFTGSTIEKVLDMTRFLHEKGFLVGAFVNSHVGHRPPMYEGLPTVEKHRSMSLYLAIDELVATGIDVVIFGDAFAGKDEIALLSSKANIPLEIEMVTSSNENNKNLINFNKVYNIRIDSSDYLLRTGVSEKMDINPFNTIVRKKFSVTVDNNQFLRYRGEINICLCDLPMDERVNVVGILKINDYVLNQLRYCKSFKFKEIGKEIKC